MYVSRICEPSLCFYGYMLCFSVQSSISLYMFSTLFGCQQNTVVATPQQASICYDSRYSHIGIVTATYPSGTSVNTRGSNIYHFIIYYLFSHLDDKFDHRAKSTIACSLHTFPPMLYLPHQASILNTANIFISRQALTLSPVYQTPKTPVR